MSEISTKRIIAWIEENCDNCGVAPRGSDDCREQNEIDGCNSIISEIESRLINYANVVGASEANHLAKVEAIKERDALKECNEKYWAIMQEQGKELDSFKEKYLTATDNLKSREAEVAELTDRHHIDLMELDAQMKSENAAIQNATKLATEVNNLKESVQFKAYEEIRLRLHEALRERDDWRDKAGRKQ